MFSVALSVAPQRRRPSLSQGIPSCGARTFLFKNILKRLPDLLSLINKYTTKIILAAKICSVTFAP